MHIAHPTYGARTRPNRTQPPTAARRTTLNAGQCVRQPREGRGRNRQPPPKKKKQQRGEGGGRENSPQPPNRPPTPPEAAKPPPQKAPNPGPRKEAQGDHPAKTGNTKPGTAAHREKGHRNMRQTHTTKKKKCQQPSPKGRGWGDRDHKARDRDTQQPAPQSKKKKKAKKHTPTTQPRRAGHSRDPGPARTPTPHARTGNGKGASGARTKPHSSHKQAETEAQPRTPQTADTRGTTPQTVPKHTHPRPQPGLAGLTKPTPNRKPDPNTNAAQQ